MVANDTFTSLVHKLIPRVFQQENQGIYAPNPLLETSRVRNVSFKSHPNQSDSVLTTSAQLNSFGSHGNTSQFPTHLT